MSKAQEVDEIEEAAKKMVLSSEEDRAADAQSSGSGGFRYADQNEVKEQRKAMWEFVKGIGSSVFEKGDLVSISLPVKIFEPRSFLERIADNWAFTEYLLAAARARDPLERFKNVMTFAIAGLHNQTSSKKPFNPILGETYEASFPDGSSIFCEQTSHHPPISHWIVEGPQNAYRFTGYGGWDASLRGNSVKARQTGPNTVEFADGGRVSWELPFLSLRGVMWGDRVLDYVGSMTFVDEKNGLRCEIKFNPDEAGFFRSLFSRQKSPSDTIRGEITNDGSTVCTVEGSWLGALEFKDNKGKVQKLWEMRGSRPNKPIPAANPLPSDCRYREDLRLLLAGDMEASQKWKVTLEDKQRREKKLRLGQIEPESAAASS